ncbi:hypothetical protein HMPREF0983_01950 [Erysipelotrichaceae bacterium 3_1_53]|nr:hypothetical protein HMPREF0983_01950 [Erysipelotrichaceae bacterium 3_1_53]
MPACEVRRKEAFMKKSELCEAYGVSLNFLQQFIDAGILKDVQYDSGKDSYSEAEVQTFSTCICLHSLGFDIKSIKEYVLLESAKRDTRKERITLLQKYRDMNLQDIHKTKKEWIV